jgi:hypothetical protein
MRTKLGAPKAITATAHKLARIIYRMVTTRQAYDETICVQNEVHNRQRLEARLRKQARPWARNHSPKNWSPMMTAVPQKGTGAYGLYRAPVGLLLSLV